jgi:hypothetical protein
MHQMNDHYSCSICESKSSDRGVGIDEASQITAAFASTPSTYSTALRIGSNSSAISPTNVFDEQSHHMNRLLNNTFASAHETLTAAVFYKTQTDLHEHFRKEHYLCKLCKKIHVVAVFPTESELEAHIKRSHRSTATQRGYSNHL